MDFISYYSELYPDKKQDLLKFRTHLSEVSGELSPLKAWQFQELSLQAAQRIMNGPSQDAIETFIHIAQNFPTQVITKQKHNKLKIYINIIIINFRLDH